MLGDRYIEMPSGLILPEGHAQRELKRQRRPKAVDLFCGCGGFSLGLIQAGWEVVGAVDKWPIALITYATNLCRWGEMQWHFVEPEDAEATEKKMRATFKHAGIVIKDDQIAAADGTLIAKPPLAGDGWIKGQPRSTPGVSHIVCGDISKLTGKRLLEIIGMKVGELDMIVGGPPCQGFSFAGKRDIADPRNNLVLEFARLIVECQPKTMCMENVTGITSMVTADGLPVMETFCRILEEGSFAGVDLIRKSMQAQGVTVMRGGRKPQKDKPSAKPSTSVDDDQADLFEAAD